MNGETPDPEAVAVDVQNALADVLGRRGLMLTRWVLHAEVMEDDGERSLWHLTTEDMKIWDTLGLVDHARLIEWAEWIRVAGQDES